MPRAARKKSECGIYHIILRGINRENIFKDDQDRERLLQTLIRYKRMCGYALLAYCLMGNHIHLLLKIGKEPLEQIMRRIGGSYVFWYNKKYERIGNLFQDRFKSEPVETDAYLLTVVRYIHQNPVKAGIEKDIAKYRWSSYGEYWINSRIIENEVILKLFNEDPETALEQFVQFNGKWHDEKCLEIEDSKRKFKDEELKEIIKGRFNIQAAAIKNEPGMKMKAILRMILEHEAVSTRQLARITGLSPSFIWRL